MTTTFALLENWYTCDDAYVFRIFDCQGTQALSLTGERVRASERPTKIIGRSLVRTQEAAYEMRMVELTGLEPATSALQGRRSPN